MEFKEKAEIRLEHWIKHDQGHLEEYRDFAGELEKAGMPRSAEAIKEMADFTEKGLECLEKALAALKD